MPAELPPAGVPPEEAIAFFRAKGYRIGFSWLDVFKAEHVRWFTVAKAMTRDLLEDVRAAVERAIEDGTTLADFKRELRPKLEAKGWWGRKMMRDPATGQHELVQLGSPRRLKTIFDTNLRTAYAAGKWERLQRTKAAFPFLEYTSVMDGRERPEHHAWNGTILSADDPWWDDHYPPCDWSCRCSIVQRSQRMLDRQGKQVTAEPARFPPEAWVNKRTGETGTLERGIGKGWDYNVGKEYLRGLSPPPLPESFDGDEVGAAADLTVGQQQLVDRFLAAFDVAAGGEAIWTDRDGWPLAIGRGWFIAPGGKARLPSGAGAVLIDRIAGAITAPDDIAWCWVRGADGRALLMRRYTRTVGQLATEVDVGAAGWRWRIVSAGAIAAAYDPRQARDSDGRWQSGRSFVLSAMAGEPGPAVHRLGDLPPTAIGRLDELGIGGSHRGAAKGVVLERGRVAHIRKRHGRDDRGQSAIGADDILKARQILAVGTIALGNPRVAPSGARRVHVSAEIGGHVYSAAFECGRKRVTLHSLRKRDRAV